MNAKTHSGASHSHRNPQDPFPVVTRTSRAIGAKPNLYCEAIELVCGGSPIPPIWFGLAFLRTRLPCSDPTTDDKNSRVELAVGT